MKIFTVNTSERKEKIMSINEPKTLMELFSNQERWCQGESAMDACNEPIDPMDKSAVCWCLDGAMGKVYGGWMAYEEAERKLCAAIFEHVKEKSSFDLSSSGTETMIIFNDCFARFEDIQAVIIKAGI